MWHWASIYVILFTVTNEMSLYKQLVPCVSWGEGVVSRCDGVAVTDLAVKTMNPDFATASVAAYFLGPVFGFALCVSLVADTLGTLPFDVPEVAVLIPHYMVVWHRINTLMMKRSQYS